MNGLRWNGLILGLAVFLVSTAGLFAHRALSEATPLAVAAWRLGLAALFFGALSLIPRHGKTPIVPLSYSARWRLTLGGLCLAAHFVTWFAALDRTSVAQATLLACTTPLWTLLGGFLLHRRRPAARDLTALATAAVGLGLVTQTSAQATTSVTLLGDLFGDLFGLSAGLFFGVTLLCSEGLHETVGVQRQVTVSYAVAAAALWAVLLMRGGVVWTYSPPVWRALLGMTLGPQIFGHTLINYSLRHFPSSQVAFAILLEPVIAALLAWFLLGQSLSVTQILGGCVVLIALTLTIRRQTPAS